MSLFDNPDQIRLLQNLLYPKEEKDDSESDDGGESLVCNKLTPATIAKPSIPINSSADTNKKDNSSSPYAPAKDESKEQQPKTMEEWEKMQEEEEKLLDNRKIPEYNITYCQALGTEDVFLQMGNRTSASASCEDLLLEIPLPEETVSVDKMSLSIAETAVDLSTPMYRLRMPLPHKINVDHCKAKYDVDSRILCLTLRLKRELDFVNF
uniref:PIH1_CS domain-containing protein n=1 Tax=Glossina brevipalpis TaxID=37001 RepID=A0A1A9WD66_9MUSC